MPLLLPNLDDRMWADLADEGRALIPVYGPEWTDHNASDPGITLVELLAWKTEMDIFRLNQVTDAERLRFLDLVGVIPRGPVPAYTVLSFTTKTGTPVLPRSSEFSGLDGNQIESRFQTLREVTLGPGSLSALQSSGTAGFQNLTPAWKRRSQLLPFGQNPHIDNSFLLGLSDPPPVDSRVTFFFTFGDGHSGWTDRKAILTELRSSSNCGCQNKKNPCCGQDTKNADGAGLQQPPPEESKATSPPAHRGVRTAWEYLTLVGGTRVWVPLQGSNGQVIDETRNFTLDGTVTFRLPATLPRLQVGSVGAPLCYVRCRIVAGQYDAAPVLTDVAYNAVPAVQKITATSTFVIPASRAITYGPSGAPTPMDKSAIRICLDSTLQVTALDFTAHAQTDPQFTILDFLAPKDGKNGNLTLEAAFLGFGTGLPAQQVVLPNPPVVSGSVRIFTQELNSWKAWELKQDFLASTRTDAHAVLDPTAGTVMFGSGEHGRVPPLHHKKNSNGPGGCLIFATFDATRAQDGKLGAKVISTLVDSCHNRALLSNHGSNPNGWTTLQSQLSSISNPLASSSGSAAESLDLAAGRADKLVDSSGRAVTLEDYEALALSTPGTRIARATAFANLHPHFPCYKAPGLITVIVLPFLPQGQPTPTPGLLQSVSNYLRSRRIVGTRVEVVGPTYLEVAVQATVQSKKGVDEAALQTNLVGALNQFLDPLVGGPDKTGWPFGRDVFRSEILKVLSDVVGVDYVTSLALIPGEGPAQCGNVCLGQTWLVAAGNHQIQVL